jgi:predicted ATPase/transcriptional regulator with XRE-family HTH domain
MDTEVSFGAWVARRRKALDLTREQFAQCVGCSVPGLRKIEADERRPSIQMAERLAHCLQIPLEERPIFLKAARRELCVERLGTPWHAQAAVRARPVLLHSTSNLPIPPTPLIGREAELAVLARLLRDPQCRLLTLVGPGGIGKTRLAIEAASTQHAAFVDGVFFVSLAATSSAEFLASAIAEAIGSGFSGPTDPHIQLINYLQDKQLLLVLDNFEHLLDGVDLLAQILERTQGPKLLITSREPLDLQREWVFQVQGLPVPAFDQVEGLEGYSAIALFLQSARRTWLNFELAPEERPHLVRICRLVEGMPLGIELAASWVRLLSCHEIAQEIEHNLDFLTTSVRDIPERHRSIRVIFDQSWRMLSAEEQQLLRQLSVFCGGFQREAAEQVAGATLSLLSALVAKSLVHRSTAGRYDLHELIRQYARERLNESGEVEATKLRQARFFLGLAETAEPHLYTSQAPFWLNRLEQEHDNLREVLNWVLEPTEDIFASQRITVGLSMATALTSFWFLRGYQQEGLARFRTLLARPEAAEPNQGRMAVLMSAGYLLWAQGHLVEARSVLEEALAINKVIEDQKYFALGLEYLGLVTGSQGDYASARVLLEQSLAIWRALKKGFRAAAVLSALGDVALLQEDYDQAERFYTEGMAPGVEMGYQVQHPYPLRCLAYLVLRRGDLKKAVELCRTSLQLNLDMYDRRGVAACLAALACVARMQGQLIRAAHLFGAVEAILVSIAATLLPIDQREYDYNIAALRGQLGADEFAAAWAEGRSMKMEQAIAYALPGDQCYPIPQT